MKCESCAKRATRRIELIGRASGHTLITWDLCDADAKALLTLPQVASDFEWSLLELREVTA